MAKLIYRSSQGRLTTIHLSKEPVRIGRDGSCELRVTDLLLSSQHCRIVNKQDQWVLEDLGSANHTYVNDDEKPISAYQLTHLFPNRFAPARACSARWSPTGRFSRFVTCRMAI